MKYLVSKVFFSKIKLTVHSIQAFILAQLAAHPSRRYSDMKPISMEPAKFMYHLNLLIKDEMVIKDNKLYSLTPKGKQFVDRFDLNELRPYSYPRITIAMLYEHPEHGVLLWRREQQPAHGLVGFILQDVQFDYSSPLTDFAAAAFSEYSGIKTTFSHRADGYVRLYNSGQLEGNMLTHVMYAKGDEKPTNDELLWMRDIPPNEIISSVSEIIEMLAKNSEHFFFEIDVEQRP